ncbi:MAG TPA: DUF305 domain-containing protein, partial [Ktedonobacterales bacterium]|nr:DUF305 domain-containing protein [Ktedonobacterales bacterium]
MTRRRPFRVVRARGPRQAEGCLQTYGQRAETSRDRAVLGHRGIRYLLRRTLLGPGLAIVALALITAAACSSPGPEDTSFMAKSDAAMTRMMAAMQISPSGDVDKDFVAMMAPHHQGAIEMAKAELGYSHNAPLRRLAQEILVTQQEEIAE